jgi:putative chitinase
MTTEFDFDFSIADLSKILAGNNNVDKWYIALIKILPDYEINTKPRVSAFLAQTAHESINFTVLSENLNYRAETLRKVFPKYFPTLADANRYAHKPEKIANKVYSNRMGNGDEASGDGYRYRGRGILQITGKNNYKAFAQSIDTPLEEIPAYLGTYEGAIQAAAWFWEENNLNPLADKGDMLGLTKKINGGTIGLNSRLELYQKIKQILA